MPMRSVTVQSILRKVRKTLVPVLLLGAFVVAVAPAQANRGADTIVLPGATSAEGITAGRGSTFYAGDLFRGDIYRGDLQQGTAELFIDAPEGRMAGGMKVDLQTGLLFVAGGFAGQGYVYDTGTGATVITYQVADPSAGPLVNDGALTRQGAWFTDSGQAQLYFVPVDPTGSLGPASTLSLTGPAAELTGDFNLNGIVATPNGDR